MQWWIMRCVMNLIGFVNAYQLSAIIIRWNFSDLLTEVANYSNEKQNNLRSFVE